MSARAPSRLRAEPVIDDQGRPRFGGPEGRSSSGIILEGAGNYYVALRSSNLVQRYAGNYAVTATY